MDFLFNPKEFLQQRKKISLFPFILLFIVTQVINSYVVSDKKSFVAAIIVGVISLVGLWLMVNIGVLITKAFLGVVEKTQPEDKKYFKQLFYIRHAVTQSILTILSAIFVTVTSGNSLKMITSIDGLVVGLISAYLLYNILKYYVGTTKLHKILPALSVILSLLSTVATFYSVLFK